MMNDEYNLQRFVDTQVDVYDTAITTLRGREMCSQWMSVIFPRFLGCYFEPGHEAFAIRSLDEARAYLAHPILGNRYREAIAALGWLSDMEPEEVFSSGDVINLHSSLTLFGEATDEAHLRTMLSIWFGCRAEELTMSQLDLTPQ